MPPSGSARSRSWVRATRSSTAAPPARTAATSIPAGVEADRAQAREPPDAAGQVGVADDLLAAVALEIDEDGGAARAVRARLAPGPAPLRHRGGEGGQQHLVHRGLVAGRHPGEQRSAPPRAAPARRASPRWRRRRAPGSSGRAPIGATGSASMPSQNAQLGPPPRRAGVVVQQLRPAAERRAHRGQRRARRRRRPRPTPPPGRARSPATTRRR